jgi:hypothetical protein
MMCQCSPIFLLLNLVVSAKAMVLDPASESRMNGGATQASVSSSSPSPTSALAKTGPSVGLVHAGNRANTVAVLSFTGGGIDPKDLATVTNRFESELLATDSFKVVERRNIDRILQEQGFQASGACDNAECSVEIGQVLSVQGILTGELSKVGKTWSLSVKRTDVGSGQTMFSHVLDIQGGLEDVLRGGCSEMAQIASGRKKPSSDRTILVAKKNSVWPWIVGGTVLVGGGVAAAIVLTQDQSSSSPEPSPPASQDPDQMIVRW